MTTPFDRQKLAGGEVSGDAACCYGFTTPPRIVWW
jgi:hypothetical protein